MDLVSARRRITRRSTSPVRWPGNLEYATYFATTPKSWYNVTSTRETRTSQRRRRWLDSPGQRVAAVREGIDQAVGDQPVQGPGQLGPVGPDRVELGRGDRIVAVAEHPEQAPPALPVRAVVPLRPAPDQLRVFRRAARGEPGAVPGHGAVGAARARRGADQRAELHH